MTIATPSACQLGSPSLNSPPQELGVCQFAKGVDAQILDILTDPSVVSLQALPSDWSVESALKLPCSP